jgi:hypothetical protein
MAKVIEDYNTPKRQVDTSVVEQVGLSYRPNLTANRIHIKQYVTGETLIRTFPKPNPDVSESRSKPPVQSGERIQRGLSRRGRSRIRKAANYYQLLVDQNRTEKAFASFVTLTYGKVYPDDKTSKKDLDNFLKRLRRKEGSNFHYVWVAERQERGAIHYHILTPNYVPKEWLNKHWNQVVNNRWKREGNAKAIQKLLPNVRGVFHAGGYMAKYISKEGENIVGNGWFVSSLTSEALKPTFEQCYDVDNKKLEEVLYQSQFIAKEDAYQSNYQPTDNVNVLWYSKVNQIAFKELTNFHLTESHYSIKRALNGFKRINSNNYGKRTQTTKRRKKVKYCSKVSGIRIERYQTSSESNRSTRLNIH